MTNIQKIIDEHYGDNNHLLIDNRYELYEDGTIYDNEKGEDIPQWIFIFRDFVRNYTRQETLDEIKGEIEKETMPAIANQEEIECCNCGEDLALESYEWMSEGYDIAKEDIINFIQIQSKKENI